MTVDDVRTARFEDLDARTAYSLWRLRERVFVVEQECVYQELDGRDLEPGTLHVWLSEPDALDGDVPIGYLRVLDDDGTARIGRVLVAPERRGQGLAERLLRRALELVGDRDSCLDAQSHLAGWYARFGYRQSGPEFVEDGIPHVPMRRP